MLGKYKTKEFMFNTVVDKSSVAGNRSGSYIFFMYQGQSIDLLLKTVPFELDGCEKYLTARKFTGDCGQIVSYLVPATCDTYIICIGLGPRDQHGKIAVEIYRRAIAHAIKQVRSLLCDDTTFIIPHQDLFVDSIDYIAQQSIITARMTEYHFDDYITDSKRKEHRIKNLFVHVPFIQDYDLIQKAVDQSMIIANGVNRTRHWIDTPPLHATPLFLAEKAAEISQSHKLNFTLFGEKEIIAMGMGGLEAVSRGSDVDCQLVIMEYKTAKVDAPTVALVGKGITFDSGGLSLKPAQSMETMKDDMAGAAAVINTMDVIAQLKPTVNVIGIAPLSENLPSGKATKPGDIIRFYNGKTAEVKNTDAEGRLILADALSYAVKHYKLDAIIDIATLTGACAYALGPYFAGLMGQHDDLIRKIEQAASQSGDYVWRLPMTSDYQRAIKSEVADICNIGDGRVKAGAITAAHFLQNFVGDVPWAHLDIAGVAFDVPHIPYYRSGATGAGVRLFVELLMKW